jgi:O-acetyl-ADP-ribose deacetylase (regulator of RNase III)
MVLAATVAVAVLWRNMDLVIGQARIELMMGNIVDQRVDAIVNAANTRLLGGGGVDGAIHRAAGPALLEACEALPADDEGRRCPTGESRTTIAGKLNAKWIIHAVGPFFNERYATKADRQLRDVHLHALRAAGAVECHSIAFPAISTGAYRFPVDRAAPIALAAAADTLAAPTSLELIRFVLYTPRLLAAFEAALRSVEHRHG